MPKVERVDTFDDLEFKGGEGVEVEATETREFSVGGRTYRTYLSEENAQAFDEAMAKWTEFAERVSHQAQTNQAARRASGGDGVRSDRKLTADIRAWAKTQQLDPPVSDRGRIPAHVTDLYFASHPDRRPA